MDKKSDNGKSLIVLHPPARPDPRARLNPREVLLPRKWLIAIPLSIPKRPHPMEPDRLLLLYTQKMATGWALASVLAVSEGERPGARAHPASGRGVLGPLTDRPQSSSLLLNSVFLSCLTAR